jgi:hypothetical protein
MPTQVQFRRGTTTQNNNFTGASGEISIDTTLGTLRVHNGSTAGGQAMVGETATQTLTNKTLTSPTINNPTFTGTFTTSGVATFSGVTLNNATLGNFSYSGTSIVPKTYVDSIGIVFGI